MKAFGLLINKNQYTAYHLFYPTFISIPVLGRCFPAVFEEGFDILEDLVDEAGDALHDREGNNITKGDLKEGSE